MPQRHARTFPNAALKLKCRLVLGSMRGKHEAGERIGYRLDAKKLLASEA
jgi:hypothetical protein